MESIPTNLYARLKTILVKCSAFANDESLRSRFVDPRISVWSNQLPQATDIENRVNMVVACLYNKYNDSYDNALVLLLKVLRDEIHSGDSLHKELNDLINELEQSEILASGDTAQQTERLDFFNRTHELDLLMQPFSPAYTLIDAPAGYGKTYLLCELQRRYKSMDGWLCSLVDFRKMLFRQSHFLLVDTLGNQLHQYISPPSGSPIEDYVDNLAQALNNANRGAVLLFDSVDELTSDQAGWLIDNLVIYISQELKSIGFFAGGRKLQIIFAGRYVTEQWSKLTSGKFELSIQPLTPFEFNVIMLTIRSAAERAKERNVILSEDDIRTISYRIMRLTGGHPGGMALIFNELRRKDFVGRRHLFSTTGQNKIYKDIVQPFIQKVKLHIPNSICPIFEILSIFRIFDYETFCHLVECREIGQHSGSESGEDLAWKLLRKVTATSLVKWEGSFYSDGVIRRLLTIEMRKEDPERYKRLCECAEKYYRVQWSRSDAKTLHRLVIETTYQQLQRYTINDMPIDREKKEKLRKEVLDTLYEYLNLDKNPYHHQERLNDLKNALPKDWEWSYLVDDLLGPNTHQDILDWLDKHSLQELGELQ